jgi:hypothetical protein
MRRCSVPLAFGVAISASAIAAISPAGAVDGVVLITQAKAVAGGVTPGDAPGFPVTISAGGSYRLASNLVVPANTDGVIVNGVEVTIDLNGFRITGGGGTVGDGIVGNQRNLTVKNGTIRNMGRFGIYDPLGAFTMIDGMRLEENVSSAVIALGIGGSITNSIMGLNGGDGIMCRNCQVQGNVVISNRGYGINVSGVGATILGNSVLSNGKTGIVGGSGTVGIGNNTIAGNTGGSLSGNVFDLLPNRCESGAC